MKRHPFLIGFICLIVLCVLFVVIVWGVGQLNLTDTIKTGTDGKVAIIKVEGIISDSQEIIERIHTLRDDDSVKAIVLRIDSPGGAVGPAQEIYEELIKIKDEKPVVTSMGTVAASGGYYIAAATQKIFANPGTITGSIGVIVEVANIEELMTKIGLKSEVIKSGKFKDALSPTRDVESDERALIQGVVDNIHNQFVEAIAEGRGMPRETVAALADGRVFSGEQALEAGLVDELGNMYDAIEAAAERAGIAGEPDVLYPPKKKPSLLEFIMGSSLETLLEKKQGITAEYIMFN
jgi:protease-4